jgi:hypothetical protein
MRWGTYFSLGKDLYFGDTSASIQAFLSVLLADKDPEGMGKNEGSEE